MFESIMLYLSFLFKFPFTNDLVYTFVVVFFAVAFFFFLVSVVSSLLSWLFFHKSKKKQKSKKVEKSNKGNSAEVKKIEMLFWRSVYKMVKPLFWSASLFMVLTFICLTGLYFLTAITKEIPYYGFESLLAEGLYFAFLFFINVFLFILMLAHSCLSSKGGGAKSIKKFCVDAVIVLVVFFGLIYILV